MAEMKNNILHKIVTWLTVIGLALTIIHVIWKTSDQNSKLNRVCADNQQLQMDVKVLTECSIELKTKVENIERQLLSIDRKLARENKVKNPADVQYTQ